MIFEWHQRSTMMFFRLGVVGQDENDIRKRLWRQPECHIQGGCHRGFYRCLGCSRSRSANRYLPQPWTSGWWMSGKLVSKNVCKFLPSFSYSSAEIVGFRDIKSKSTVLFTLRSHFKKIEICVTYINDDIIFSIGRMTEWTAPAPFTKRASFVSLSSYSYHPPELWWRSNRLLKNPTTHLPQGPYFLSSWAIVQHLVNEIMHGFLKRTLWTTEASFKGKMPHGFKALFFCFWDTLSWCNVADWCSQKRQRVSLLRIL